MTATVSNRTGKEAKYGGVTIPANGRTNIRTSQIQKEELDELQSNGFTVIQNKSGDHLLVDVKAEAKKEAESKATEGVKLKSEEEAKTKSETDAFEALKKEATKLGVEFDGRTNYNSLKQKVDKAKKEAKGDS